MKMSLVVLSAGKAAGQSIPILAPQFVIGRDPQCNLRPGSAMISKRHCAVLIRNNRVFLRDFESTNGTFLNNNPVKGEVTLKDGDLLKVGPLEFKIVLEGVATVTKPTPLPQPRNSDGMDDDAAALLLNIDENDQVTGVSKTSDTENEVPGGTTLMEIPVTSGSGEQKIAAADTPPPPGDSKPAEVSKPPEKKKVPAGAAQDAAKAILEKLRQGRRK